MNVLQVQVEVEIGNQFANVFIQALSPIEEEI